MPKMKIDGAEYEFPSGFNVLRACNKIGKKVPHFCYHPMLSIVGSCRMCKVEVIQNEHSRIDISCNVTVQDGLEIITDSPAVLTARRMTLEFLLANHPLDCPICDDAGECKLQDYYFDHGLYDSRMYEQKRLQFKARNIGRSIVHDSERCVICSRCTRFVAEVTKTFELGIFGMGSNEEVMVAPGMTLDNEYAGNVVDLCPVGALTDKDFRFKRRVWFLQESSSICQLCSRGCNVRIDYDIDPFHAHKQNIMMKTHRTGSTHYSRIQRIKPRYNKDANGHWICDTGRYGYRFTDDADRLLDALIRADGTLETVKTASAIKLAAQKITSATGKDSGKVAVVVSPQLTSEELFTVYTLFREKLNLPNIDHRLPINPDWTSDDLLKTPDPFPNRTCCEWLELMPTEKGIGIAELPEAISNGRIDTLISILANPLDYLNRKALSKLKHRIFIMRNLPDELREFTDIALPAAAWGEYMGTFTNFQGRIQRLKQAFEPLGDARPVWRLMNDLSTSLKKPLGLKSYDDVFNALTRNIRFFSELTWNKIGERGIMALQEQEEAVV